MHRIRKVLALTLAFAMLLISIPFTSVEAATAEELLYSSMFSVRPSAYYMTCQPTSAILLTDNIQLTPAMLSPNYKGGVVDLPRLKSKYYYQLSKENPAYWIGDTLYPTLVWNTAAVGTEVRLSICSEENGAALCTVNIAIDASRSTTMKGIDDWYKVEHINIKNDGTVEKTYTVEFHDASENIVNDLVAEAGAMRYYKFPAGLFSLYDSAMHKKCIIMDTYAYTVDDVSAYHCLDDFAANYTYKDFDSLAYTFYQHEGADIKTTFNVKDHLGTLNTDARAGLLFYGSKTKDCVFNNNNGIASTTTGIADTDTLYYFIALSNECYFSKITGGIALNELNHASKTAPNMTWSADHTYTMQSGVDWVDAGYTGDPSGNNPRYLQYGPVSFDAFSESVDKYNLIINNDKYDYTHMLSQPVDNLNVFATSLLYAASIPHLGKLTMQPAAQTITVNYYYQLPDSEVWQLLCLPKTYNATQFEYKELEELPEFPNFEAKAWYTDTNLSTPVNQSSYSKTQTQVINLYGGYEYSGGYYFVTYYDDYNNKELTTQYRLIDQPELPETPTGAPGTNFKQWIIVTNKNDAKGVAYSKETFAPVRDGHYLFKTTWGIVGVITRVVLDKKSYYLGAKLDLEKIHVFVRLDDSGKEVEATSSEYSVDPMMIKHEGANFITVTLLKSGYQSTVQVTGVRRSVSSITAKYIGGDVTVGQTLAPGAFVVTLEYSDGSSETTTNFTISPPRVKRNGRNTIIIKYLELTTTCTVTGIEASEYEEPVKVVGLEAHYSGPAIKVNQQIDPETIAVIATYENGRKVTIATSDFTFTPNSFYSTGVQTIMCMFGGMTATTEITVIDDVPVEVEPENPPINPPDTPSETPGSGDNGNNGWQPPDSGTGNNTPGDTSNNGGSSNNGSNNHTPPSNGWQPSSPSDNNTNYTPPTSNNGQNGTGGGTPNTGGGSGGGSTGKGTSIGYLNGANILTNIIAGSPIVDTTARAEISSTIIDALEGQAVFLTLTNGYSGNQLTAEDLSLIRDKHLNCYIDVVEASDPSTSIANWVIAGDQLNNISGNMNPNIIFEQTRTDTANLLYMSTSQADFPVGVSLTIIPPARYFTPGDLLRLYSCTADYGNAHMMRVLNWTEQYNSISVFDLNNNLSLCLSNGMDVVAEGGNLLKKPEEVVEEPQPNPETPIGDEVGDISSEIQEGFDQFEDVMAESGKFFGMATLTMFILFGVVPIVLFVTAIVIIVIVVKRKRAR